MKSSNINLALGTVQFGLVYGINNKSGRPDDQNLKGILSLAQSSGISILDSADEYGDSLERIRKISEELNISFRLVSKLCLKGRTFTESLKGCLSRLGTPSVYGYLFHRIDEYYSYADKNEFLKSKESGLVEKVGVSIYSSADLEKVCDDPFIDIIQIPFNILDSHPLKIDLLKKAKTLGKEIHVRSVFLQGLFFMEPDSLPEKLRPLRESLKSIQNIRKDVGMDMQSLCLAYVHSFPFIDQIIVGVDNCNQLERNLSSFRVELSPEVVKRLNTITVSQTELLNPANWS